MVARSFSLRRRLINRAMIIKNYTIPLLRSLFPEIAKMNVAFDPQRIAG